jgi:hypothetical protein
MDRLAAVPAQTIPFLAGQVKPDPKVDAEMLAAFIKDLGNDRFEVRDRAMRELEKWLAGAASLATGPQSRKNPGNANPHRQTTK